MDRSPSPSPCYPVVTGAGRPDFVHEFYAGMEGTWPVIANQNPTAGRHWDQLNRDFPEFQFALRAPEGGEYVAVGSSIPVAWSGDLLDLPDQGWDWAMGEGCAGHDAGRSPNLLCDPSRSLHPAAP